MHTDQLGQAFSFKSPPKRIVSLVPSQTELLHALGLEDSIVGITKFCVHPSQYKTTKTMVGGTKDFSIEKILALKPDIIIANKEENEPKKIRELQNHIPVWVSDVVDIASAIDMIQRLAALTGVEADGLISKINSGYKSLANKPLNIRALYFIWKNPYMAAGTDTFISDVLANMGIHNIVAQHRYPALTEADIIALNPGFILLSSEPYPFSNKHIAAFKAMLPHAQVHIIDGEMCSWYGSRMAQAVDYLEEFKLTICSK